MAVNGAELPAARIAHMGKRGDKPKPMLPNNSDQEPASGSYQASCGVVAVPDKRSKSGSVDNLME